MGRLTGDGFPTRAVGRDEQLKPVIGALVFPVDRDAGKGALASEIDLQFLREIAAGGAPAGTPDLWRSAFAA